MGLRTCNFYDYQKFLLSLFPTGLKTQIPAIYNLQNN